MQKQIICIKWGAKYGAEYANRLHAMVARNITPPFSFTCFTDRTEGLNPAIRALPLPPVGVDIPTFGYGIWGKSRLWSETLGDLTGPVLFLDLDMVILGSLDPFFSHGHPDDVILARNPNTPFERLGQTSLYRFPVGKLAPLKAMFEADPEGTARSYRFEQRFVSRNAPGGISFWPRAWVAHFKWHCIPPLPLNYLRAPRPPKGARVVIFPGPLNPPDAIAGRWREGHAALPPLAHVRAGLRGDRKEPLWTHLRHYLRPCPWVAEHWDV